MTEPVVRALVVVGVLGVAAAVAVVQRRGMAIRRIRRRFSGLQPGVVLFSSSTCSSCATVRGLLDRLDTAYSEVAYEHDAAVFERLGIDRVPALASVAAEGEGWIAYGVPSSGRLAGWLADP